MNFPLNWCLKINKSKCPAFHLQCKIVNSMSLRSPARWSQEPFKLEYFLVQLMLFFLISRKKKMIVRKEIHSLLGLGPFVMSQQLFLHDLLWIIWFQYYGIFPCTNLSFFFFFFTVTFFPFTNEIQWEQRIFTESIKWGLLSKLSV